MPYMSDPEPSARRSDQASDEQTGLLEGDGYGPASVSPPRQQKRPSFVWRVFALLRRLSSRLNFLVSRRPWRLFEFCDLWLCPPFLRQRCQAMLTAEWTHKLPFIQSTSPAKRAAALIIRTLDRMPEVEKGKFSIVDFCSGGGGPVPVIEKLVNAHRLARNQHPIPFLLTDIQPHLDAWMAASARSANLSFIPQPVDATNPPVAVISSASPTAASDPNAEFAPDSRIFRLYCLAFHHFDDAMARKTLKSSIETSDGFAIIELQDRRIGSLVLMVLDFFLMFAVTSLWFRHDGLHMLFTFVVPVLPFIQAFDGFVSSLRTRTFEEVMALVDEACPEGEREGAVRTVDPEGREVVKVTKGDWVFEGEREMHTWPLGFMNSIVGRRIR